SWRVPWCGLSRPRHPRTLWDLGARPAIPRRPRAVPVMHEDGGARARRPAWPKEADAGRGADPAGAEPPLLDRQMLLRQAPLPSGRGGPERVSGTVERRGGGRARAPSPPYYGLWSRLAGFRPDDLADLLLNRAVVRIALMRSTIHLVSARDCVMLRPL